MKKRATHPGVGERRVKSRRFLRFLEEYAESGNAYQAALRAGYSPKMAKGRSYELARLARSLLFGDDLRASLAAMRLAESRARSDTNTPGVR